MPECDQGRIALPVLECIAACRDLPPAVTTIKSILRGTWKPIGIWLQHPDSAEKVRDAMPTIEQLCNESGLNRYHDDILSEMLDALLETGYITRKGTTSSNDKHYASEYQVYELAPMGDQARRQRHVRLPELPLLQSVLNPSRAVRGDISGSNATSPSALAETVLATSTEPWAPTTKWQFCNKRPGLEGGKPSWEQSYDRWIAGEPLLAVAHNAQGKSVKLETVRRHIVEALMQGRGVALGRLADEAGWALPTAREWSTIDDAAAKLGIDPRTPDFRAKPLVSSVAKSLTAPDAPGSTASSPVDMKRCYECIEWWATLKRVAFPLAFAVPDQKRRRTEPA